MLLSAAVIGLFALALLHSQSFHRSRLKVSAAKLMTLATYCPYDLEEMENEQECLVKCCVL